MCTTADTTGVQPCLVLAHPDSAYAAAISQVFRRQGWDIYLARSGLEVRRLAWLLQAHLVVLSVSQPDESGFLTCAKLLQELPRLKVVLICSPSMPHEQDDDLATFVGASALCNEQEGADLLNQLADNLVPVTG